MIIDLFHYPTSISDTELGRLAPALQVKVFTSILVTLAAGSPTPEARQVATDLLYVRRYVLESLSDDEAHELTIQYLDEIQPDSLRSTLLERIAAILDESKLTESGFIKAVFAMQKIVRSKRLFVRRSSSSAPLPPPRKGPTVKGFK